MKLLSKIGALAMIAFLMSACSTPPTVEFTVSSEDITVYDEVAFTNMSVDATSYSWDFGDDATSTEENPTHVYMTPGTYTVKLTASNDKESAEAEKEIVVKEVVNTYTIGEDEFDIVSSMFWYQSGMGGDPYIRLETPTLGNENPDLLKLYPVFGVGESLEGTYTFDNDTKPNGTYDAGFTFNYAGMTYDSTAIAKTGSGDLVITKLEDDVYKFQATIALSIGNYDFQLGEFVESSAATLVLDYIGGVTALEK